MVTKPDALIFPVSDKDSTVAVFIEITSAVSNGWFSFSSLQAKKSGKVKSEISIVVVLLTSVKLFFWCSLPEPERRTDVIIFDFIIVCFLIYLKVKVALALSISTKAIQELYRDICIKLSIYPLILGI